MNAAQRLFLERGVAPTTIEQITAAADVAKGTFYLYFPSKEAICAALGDRFGQQLRARIEAAVGQAAPGNWAGKLRAWAAAASAEYLNSIELHDILFYAQPPTREGLVDNVVIDHLAGLLREGAAAGAWTLEDPRLTAVFLFSGLHAAVDDAYLHEGVDRNVLASQLGAIYLRSVGLA
jgi:AcrR family transcriptional regulator